MARPRRGKERGGGGRGRGGRINSGAPGRSFTAAPRGRRADGEGGAPPARPARVRRRGRGRGYRPPRALRAPAWGRPRRGPSRQARSPSRPGRSAGRAGRLCLLSPPATHGAPFLGGACPPGGLPANRRAPSPGRVLLRAPRRDRLKQRCRGASGGGMTGAPRLRSPPRGSCRRPGRVPEEPAAASGGGLRWGRRGAAAPRGLSSSLEVLRSQQRAGQWEVSRLMSLAAPRQSAPAPERCATLGGAGSGGRALRPRGGRGDAPPGPAVRDPGTNPGWLPLPCPRHRDPPDGAPRTAPGRAGRTREGGRWAGSGTPRSPLENPGGGVMAPSAQRHP